VTRIIAGSARGRRLRAPTGDATRPTTDRVREALFSALTSELGTLAGTRFLDVYAGSGAVGLEARSRGAGHVTLVEQSPQALAVIRQNVAALGFEGVEIVAGRAERLERRSPTDHRGFDVGFLDPPYELGSDELAAVVLGLGTAGWFAPDAVLVVERGSRSAWTWPHPVVHVRDRRYGETMLWYGRWALPVYGSEPQED
jgi:16S rRNA (guanine966-N2)-methyltransferase